MTSLGERRVRVEFNPSNNDLVSRIKQRSAELINLCEEMKQATKDGEVARLCALAQTDYEVAAMHAVKAATAGK